ncbi:MAG: hypothetical protein WCZ89_06620 [Phycisphaerae bacterium]
MVRKIASLILVLISTVFAANDEQKSQSLLRDGFVLSGVDGKLVARGQKWFFELERDVSDGANVVEAGTKIEMLLSSGLEKMLADLQERPGASYRLFNALVTRYKGRNFIFSDYFLPMAEVSKKDVPRDVNQPELKNEVAINEPEDAVVIPQEIIERLQTRRVIRPETMRGKFELKQDSILANRTGFIVEREDGTLEFIFDGLGRNMPRISLELLPSYALERTEIRQATDPGRKRYRVSGIVTKYGDKYYLLVQQATRAYGYGNFGT